MVVDAGRRISERRSAQIPSVHVATSSHRESQSLEELAEHIRTTVPLPTPITSMDLNREAGVVEMTWQSRRFLVKPSFEVFELKGRLLYINGTSILIQALLSKQDKNARVVNTLIDSMERVEDLFQRRQFDSAFSLLNTVRQAVKRLAGSRAVSMPG